MGLISWLKTFFGGAPIPVSGDDLRAAVEDYASSAADVAIRELAFWNATNMIANAISKCEFKTYDKNVETKGKEYYLWNYEPNVNQCSSTFLQKLIAMLYRYNECLVVEQNNQLFVADSYNAKEYAMFENVFTDVTVGDFKFNRSFVQSEVMFFKLKNKNMREIVNGIFESYSQLLNYTMTAYQKSRGTKGLFKYETLPIAGTAERKTFDALVNEKIGKWLTGDNAALPLGKGQEWKELTQKTYSNENTRDIRAQIDDISDFTAKAFDIPPALLRGDVQGTKDAVDNFITFCIRPLVEMLGEEINRKRYGFNGIKNGTYLRIDIKQIRHVDMLSAAANIDKLISSGLCSVNDIREIVGEVPILEDWANEHYITKNYAPFDEVLNSAEGG